MGTAMTTAFFWFRRSAVSGVVFALSSAYSWMTAHAQARPTATRAAGISIFGGVTRVKPAYSPDTNYGGVIGADYTRYFRFFAPSIEVRYSDTSGPTVGESTITGGLKLETRLRRFSPYGELAVGYGSITFAHPIIYPTGPYSSDNSFIVAAGGGVDFSLSRTLALKVDVQTQSWKLGAQDQRRSPSAVTLGVVVHLPFQGLRGRR